MPDRLPHACRQCPRIKSPEEALRCPASPSCKMAIRRAVNTSLGSMSPEIRRIKSRAIVRRLISQSAFQQARMIMAYVAMEMEVDLWTLVREAWSLGKRISMPRIVPPLDEPRIPYVHDRHIIPYELVPAQVDEPSEHPGLAMDILGIWEPKATSRPVAPAEVDLVLVPCVAYDRRGGRMGKGGGFYDRLLSGGELRATTVGVAFSEQVFSTLPHCPHDRPVDLLITETSVTDFRGDCRR